MKALAELCAAGGHAGGGADRHRQPLRRARVLRGRWPRPAIQPIMGCQLALAHADPAHPGERPPPPRPVVLLAQDETGFRNLMKLSSLNYLDCGAAEPHVTLAAARRPCRGPDLPDRRRRRSARPADPRRPAERRRARSRSGSPGSSPAGSTSRSSATRRTAPRAPPPRRRPSPGSSALAYDLDLPLVATNDVHFPGARALRRARRADLHRRRRLCRPAGAAAPADARALLQGPGRDGGAVRRPARGGREHRRDRPALRLPAAEAQADPAAVRRGRGRGAAPPGARGARGAPRRHPALGARRGLPRRGSSSSSA